MKYAFLLFRFYRWGNREIKQLALGHTAGKKQSQGFKPRDPDFRVHVAYQYTCCLSKFEDGRESNVFQHYGLI